MSQSGATLSILVRKSQAKIEGDLKHEIRCKFRENSLAEWNTTQVCPWSKNVINHVVNRELGKYN